uniref:Uncharacterized protein n=1 Tax=Siphoviridae sp. ct7aK2 TaxID=2825351 RepID=A0A8S5U9K2_9CAUD|nr:MAG TPA: hypothetical protein [Siphoviridae sp. ct7aK2]
MFGPYVTVKLYTDFLLPRNAFDIFMILLFIITIMFNRLL